jgi:hypothetical protein
LARQAQQFIQVLHDHIAPHLFIRDGRPPNYEDYFACLKQIVQDETGEIVNPLIEKNAAALKDAAVSLYLDISPHIDDNKFASLAERASDLIQCVVYQALVKLGPPKGMDIFAEAARKFDLVDIFSLNHDLLIEKRLENEEIPYVDGFDDPEGDAIRFSWSWKRKESGVRLFKLHGSVDWYLFRFKNNGIESDQYAKLRKSPDWAHDASGNRLDVLEIVPSFLTGTTIKEQAYGYSLYGELFEQFRHVLLECETLFVSGYGWFDKGINIRIHQWLRDKSQNKLVILHKRGADRLRQTRFWYWNWERYEHAGKVTVVPEWLSECSVDDLARYIIG